MRKARDDVEVREAWFTVKNKLNKSQWQKTKKKKKKDITFP